MLPNEYGNVMDPLGMGVGVTLSRAGVVARVRLKFTQLGKGDVSLVTGSRKSRGRSRARSRDK